MHGRGEIAHTQVTQDQKQSATTKRQKSWNHDKESETGPLQNPTEIFVDI